MKLSESHIQQLFTFAQKHYVEWYDVQTELVDHLANGIEAQWEQNSNLSFEVALKTEFKKFGIMGFTEVIEQKTKALNKRYWSLIYNHIKSFFKLPRIILTVFLVWVYFQIFNVAMVYHVNWVLVPTLGLLFGVPWYFWIKEYRRSKKTMNTTGKKWLFENTISQIGGMVHLMNIAIYFQVIYHSDTTWSTFLSIVFSVGVVLFGMLIYVAIYEVTPKLRKEMAKNYPDYKLI